jgi:hypothetical protein
MNATVDSPELVHRLLENRSINTAKLSGLGLATTNRIARCEKCGLHESILFWSADESEADQVLYFSCPRGCGTRTRLPLHEVETPQRASGAAREEKGADSLRPGQLKALLLSVVCCALSVFALLFGRDAIVAALTDASTPSGVSRPQSTSLRLPRDWGTAASPAVSNGQGGFGGSSGRSSGGLVSSFRSLWESPSERVFIAVGDRRDAVAQLVDEVSASYGESSGSVVRSVQYLEDAGVTQVTVETGLPAWTAYFAKRLPEALALASASGSDDEN